jgi:hypothetical protein
MEDKIQPYRQPMVTVTGFLLGFLLNYAIGWIAKPSSLYKFEDTVSMLVLVTSIILFSIVLFRILNIRYPKESAEKYYQTTLRFFMAGLICILLGIFVVMVKSFFR